MGKQGSLSLGHHQLAAGAQPILAEGWMSS